MNDWCNWIFVMKMSLISYDILLHVYFLNTIFWRIHFKPLILQHGWWNVWDFCVTSLHEWSYLFYFENFFLHFGQPTFWLWNQIQTRVSTYVPPLCGWPGWDSLQSAITSQTDMFTNPTFSSISQCFNAWCARLVTILFYF